MKNFKYAYIEWPRLQVHADNHRNYVRVTVSCCQCCVLHVHLVTQAEQTLYTGQLLTR